jgi:hypothetical protein
MTKTDESYEQNDDKRMDSNMIRGDDITVRLTRWCEQFVDRTATQGLMDQAADEIERLRNGGACPHVRGTVTQHCSLNFTLTDAEREAIYRAEERLRLK